MSSNVTSVSVSEKSFDFSSTAIIVIVALVISVVLMIAIISLWWYLGSLTPEDTPSKSNVPAQEKVHPKKDHFKERYMAQRTNSYQKTVYFRNASGQTKENSFQKSQISPKLYNPKFVQQKSHSVGKLKHVPRDPSGTRDSKTKKLQGRSSKVKQTGKVTTGSPLKSEFKWIIFCLKLIPLTFL